MALSSVLAWICFVPAAMPPPDTFDLVWRPRPRQLTRYRVTLNFDLAGTSMDLNADLVQSVGRRDKTGAFDVSTTTKNVRVTTGADTQTLPAEKPSVERYDGQGRRIARSDDPSDLFARVMGSCTDFLPPASPVKVGQKWSVAIKGDPASGVSPARLDFRLLGVDKRGKTKLLHVRYSFAEITGKLPVKADGYYYIDPRDFSIVESRATIQNARMSPEIPPGSVDVRMIREG